MPAFSVPRADRDNKHNLNPGPGQYNPEESPKHVKNQDPLYSFGKDDRRQIPSDVPGPGSYEPKGKILDRKQPSFTMLSKRELIQQRNPTGPGSYEPAFNFGKDKAPAYSLKGRKDQKMQLKPGPGQYELIDLSKSRSHNFGKDARDKNVVGTVPGPGSYEYEQAMFKYGSKMEPKYGFGSRLDIKDNRIVPGPGQYEPKSEIYSHIGGIVSRDLKDSFSPSKTPGPGNYETDINRVKNKDPSYSLSKSSRDYRSSDLNIGPGQYQHDKNFKSVHNSVPKSDFGGKAKRLSMEDNLNPGPGAYDSPFIKSKKSIKIGERMKNSESSLVPGPGAYEHMKNSEWLTGKGRYSLGRESRLLENNSHVPGPGSYEDKLTKIVQPHGKVTFGRDEKLRHQKNANPGPGHYELKPFFADLPKYVLQGK